VQNVDYIVADGLTGISEAISRVFPKAKYQYCVLHACRSSLNKVRASDKKAISVDLKDIYGSWEELGAPNEENPRL
jgi:transposase-like protein